MRQECTLLRQNFGVGYFLDLKNLSNSSSILDFLPTSELGEFPNKAASFRLRRASKFCQLSHF